MLSGRAIVMTPTEPPRSAADTDTMDAGVRPTPSDRAEPIARDLFPLAAPANAS